MFTQESNNVRRNVEWLFLCVCVCMYSEWSPCENVLWGYNFKYNSLTQQSVLGHPCSKVGGDVTHQILLTTFCLSETPSLWL
jgi:hypothetical protein